MYEMNLNVSSCESFLKLEEFSSFSSCIRSFGKPILPPLVTPTQRFEISRLRIAAVNKEVAVMKRRKEQLNLSEKEQLSFSYKQEEPQSYYDFDVHQPGVLYSSSSRVLCGSGMFVVMSNVMPNDICSTVHKDVIVCPDVTPSNRCSSKTAYGVSNALTRNRFMCGNGFQHSSSLECHLCQAEYCPVFDDSHISENNSEVPYGNFFSEQKSGVSDDEQQSVTETECCSLPTVICNKTYVANDTDCESNNTYITQSTDLDKYMDASVDLSSSDCSSAVWESKASSYHNVASKSDDASSETMVNTESELTPCASAMTDLSYYIDNPLSSPAEVKTCIFDELSCSNVRKRAHSVDSFMKLLPSVGENCNVRKSHSEPSHSAITSANKVCDEPHALQIQPTHPNILQGVSNAEEGAITKSENTDPDISNSVLLNNKDLNLDTSSKGSKDCIRKHIRRNSYTLEYPSTALIIAHAGCECNLDSSKCEYPHCASVNQKELEPNLAFKKEKVTKSLSLPANSKVFPIPSTETISTGNNVVETTAPCSNIVFLNSEESAKIFLSPVDESSPFLDNEEDFQDDTFTFQDSQPRKVCEKTNVNIENNHDSQPVDVEKDLQSVDLQNVEKQPPDSPDLKSNASKEILVKIYQELQESHKMRVKELLEEQKRQWLKLQEEFKLQEKMLTEKLNNLAFSDAVAEGANALSDIGCFDDGNNKVEELVAQDVFSSQNSDVLSPGSYLEHNGDFGEHSKSSVEHLEHIPDAFSGTRNKIRALPSVVTGVNSEHNSESLNCDNVTDINAIKDHTRYENTMNGDMLSENDYNSLPTHGKELRNDSIISVSHIQPGNTSSPKSPNTSEKNIIDAIDIHIRSQMHNDHVRNNIFNDTNSRMFYASCSSDLDTTSNSNKSPKMLDQNIYAFSKGSLYSRPPELLYGEKFSHNVHNFCTSPENLNHKAVKDQNLYFNSFESPDDMKEVQHLSNGITEPCKESKSPNKTYVLSPEHTSLCCQARFESCVPLSLCNKTKKKEKNNLVNEPAILKKFEKLPAFVKGYLTRRLLKTERVQQLTNTLQDTLLLLGKLRKEQALKGGRISEADLKLQKQLLVQLFNTLDSVHDIFYKISTKERMEIIAESRHFRLKQKEEKNLKESSASSEVAAKPPTPQLPKKPKLSAVTLKRLERKKRSDMDNRTYTIEDFEFRRSRSQSSPYSKCHSTSPHHPYKASVGRSPKRKTSSLQKSAVSRRCKSQMQF